ncbi:MAG TPA: Gfo/Idh/MocA family oxidoreductase, partial [Gemmatimonadaceae bacterium]|nr:Gfo/Idh/MocA family oxidoreductase [Gemmatimonadaceae bacterium]
FRFPLTNPDDVRMNAEWGGGALLDVGCYCVSAGRLFLGDAPIGATAVGVYHPVKKVDTSVQGVLEYARGRCAVVSCGFDSGVHQRVIVCGTGGTLELTQPFKSWSGKPAIVVRTADREETLAFDATDTFRLEVDDFALAIMHGGAPLVGASDALRNMEILDRLALAARA